MMSIWWAITHPGSLLHVQLCGPLMRAAGSTVAPYYHYFDRCGYYF